MEDSLDFAIIGIPRSGTSSLFDWLDAHPGIEGAHPKETFFLMDESHPLCGRHGVSFCSDGTEAWRHFFCDGTNNGRARFEGTTHYFYQQTARDYLTSANASARVVMLLREPAQRLLSSFRFTRDNLAYCDRALTFDQYVEWLLADETGKLDRFYKSEASLWVAKRALAFGKYVQWIDWWLESLPRERLRLMLFEQMRAGPRGVVMDLCEWLGVDADWYADHDFNAKNATYAVGEQGLHRIIRRLAPLLPRNSIREKVKPIYLRWQSRAAAPDVFYEEGVQRIRAYFAPYNRELASRYGLDLQRWWGTDVLNGDG